MNFPQHVFYYFYFPVFEVGESIQAIDYPCGIWRDGTDKKVEGHETLVAFVGIFKCSQRDGWVKAFDIRKAVDERLLWARNAPVPRMKF